MSQSTRIRIVLYSLLLLCALQTWGICLQARWLQEQRVLIRQLWQDLHGTRSVPGGGIWLKTCI